MILSADCVFDTAISATSLVLRPARSAALAMRSRMAVRLEAMVMDDDILGANARPSVVLRSVITSAAKNLLLGSSNEEQIPRARKSGARNDNPWEEPDALYCSRPTSVRESRLLAGQDSSRFTIPAAISLHNRGWRSWLVGAAGVRERHPHHHESKNDEHDEARHHAGMREDHRQRPLLVLKDGNDDTHERFSSNESRSRQHPGILDASFLCIVEVAAIAHAVGDPANHATEKDSESSFERQIHADGEEHGTLDFDHDE